MSIIFDIGIVGIIILSTFIGYKQGLVKSAIKILSFFIAIIVALTLYKPVSSLIINKTPIYDNIKGAMIEKIKPEGIEVNEEIDIQNNAGDLILNSATNTIEGIAGDFTTKLIETVILLLLFIIVKIVLKFVSILSDIITKLPLIKQVNKVGGTLYGVIKGVIVVYTILAVVYLIAPLMQNTIIQGINNSVITNKMYNNNLILKIIA